MEKRWLPVFIVLCTTLGAGACDRVDPELRPDALLRDSLGLGDDDRVYTVRISADAGGERAEPATIRLMPGDFVQFVTEDRRPHTVGFLLDSLPDSAAAFLRASAQYGSPPLVELDSRFLVTFRSAPEGRYPFVVRGTGEPARGAVMVGSREAPS